MWHSRARLNGRLWLRADHSIGALVPVVLTARTLLMEENMFAPVTGTVTPRYAGLATLMRLPHIG